LSRPRVTNQRVYDSPPMNLVLVTGAGASRNLGLADEVMPLMPDWSNQLCEALDAREAKLAASCHLKPGLSAEEFEENLGLLLRWAQVIDLHERFEGLGGPNPGEVWGQVQDARANTRRRVETVMEAINSTLYDQFGLRRVEDQKAKEAYNALLGSLGDAPMAVATTNYDRAGEVGLEELGVPVDTGFRGSHGRTPTLQPIGIVENRREKTPFLHLHGAVGWYEKAGDVFDLYADLPYNPSLGTPVVLYPDPEKDPTSDAVVSELWAEFRAALGQADRVFVIGHSLHDPALVRELSSVAREKKVAVSHRSDAGADRITNLIPQAIPIQMDFGPSVEVKKGAMDAFRN